jgi:serine/threonine-protein kinase
MGFGPSHFSAITATNKSMGILDKFFGGSRKEPLDVSARFRLDRHAFTGTMSKFHVAQEIGTNKLYGLKFLDEEKTAYFRARFKGLDKPTEGEIAMKIRHPKIVETYEYGVTTTGQEYIMMEYINGPGLDITIRRRDEGLFPNRMKLIREMAEAIQSVHEHGFIHRDVCPRNFICYKDFSWLKLIDFGLTVPDLPPYRMPGNRTGTPQYMAPEIVRRRETDRTVDVFAFGVTVYRLLTFEHPWGSTDTTGMAALAHDSSEVTQILDHRPDLNKKLAAAIHKCLEINPVRRTASCKQFLSAIRGVVREDSA